MTVDVSPDVLKVIAEAEAKRAESGDSSPEVKKKVTDSIVSAKNRNKSRVILHL